MKPKVHSLSDCGEAATDAFYTFKEGQAEIIPTGIHAVDMVIGGVMPGQPTIIGAGTGVGKSSVILSAALASSVPVGIVSCEDDRSVVGLRVLAALSGVNSISIRRKSFNEGDQGRIQGALEQMAGMEHVKCTYPIAGSYEMVLDSMKALIDTGCKHVVVDYLQKIRMENANDNRRLEIDRMYGGMQRLCYENEIALTIASQFRRVVDPTAPPQISWMKESGNLEIEARQIILLQKDPKRANDVIGRLAKSTNGGEGTQIRWRRQPCGTLEEVPFHEESDYYEEDEFS